MLRLARTAMRTRWEIVLADDADPAYLRAAGEVPAGEQGADGRDEGAVGRPAERLRLFQKTERARLDDHRP